MRFPSRRTTIAAVALALASLPHIPADAAQTETCFGKKADYVGTNKADDIGMGEGRLVAVLKGGNDKVTIDEDSIDGPVYLCMGDGRDKVSGPAARVHGGNGEDYFEWQGNCDTPGEEMVRVFRVEEVRIWPCQDRSS